MSAFLQGYFSACKGGYRVNKFKVSHPSYGEFYRGYDKAVKDGKCDTYEREATRGIVRSLEA